jgi:hypothetical protein
MALTSPDCTLVRAYHVGVDVGQASDPTAVAIVEHVRAVLAEHAERVLRRPDGRPLPGHAEALAALPGERFNLVHLERLKLQTAYPLQVAHVLQLLAREPLASNPPRVWLDATGVGKAIADLFRAGGLRRMTAVTITGGRETIEQDSERLSVPKLELIGRLQGALHSGTLRIPPTLPDAKTFTRELAEFRASWTDHGNLTLNARQGQHDDTISAVALAVWGAARKPRRAFVQPLRV